MKIDLLPEAIQVKKRPYKLAHKYKEIVKTKIDSMLTAGIIYPIDQSKWASPMVLSLVLILLGEFNLPELPSSKTRNR